MGCSLRHPIFHSAMRHRVTTNDFARMIAAAASRILQEQAELSALDSVAGDGDHGTTMRRAVEQLEQVTSLPQSKDFKTIFEEAGWAVLRIDGGASSLLFGSFFLGMADAEIQGESFDCREFALALECGLKAVCRQTEARPGDKTIMDALMPAVEAFREAADDGETISHAFADAARAARRGAESTKNLVARFGRGKLIGRKTLGFNDPGATSVALLLEGFCGGLAASKEEENHARHG